MISKYKNEELKQNFHIAGDEAKAHCDLVCCCSTCRYAAYPSDYETTGYLAYCKRIRKEKC